jgi:hypothetical protein
LLGRVGYLTNPFRNILIKKQQNKSLVCKILEKLTGDKPVVIEGAELCPWPVGRSQVKKFNPN